MWRVGYVSSPLEYPPHPSWANRFDDPGKRFRTLYCARDRLTSLREVLADFGPDLKTLRVLLRLPGDVMPAAGYVPWKWRKSNALAPARLDISQGELVRLDDLTVRRQLELEYVDFLVSHRVKRLDISKLRSKDRIVTQKLAGALFDRGAAGIAYKSNVDDHLCVALFEGRARLVPAGDPEPLSEPVRGLGRVCKELGLILFHG